MTHSPTPDPTSHESEVLGFVAFPARRRGRGRFARTWWGNAWVEAMEASALDERQLKRGRALTHAGRVGPITVSPGRIAASVDDGDALHRTEVRVERLTDAEWDRFLDQVAERAGHVAALLDGDMPHDLVDAAADAGVRLLPDVGDLDPECDCPGWEHPCPHAAALSFQAAWLLDADPLVLLLMRGRGRRALVAALNQPVRGGANRATPADGEDAGVGEGGARPAGSGGTPAVDPAEEPVPAAAAYAATATLGPLPEPPPPIVGPDSAPPLPAGPGVDPAALARLIDTAARRARDLLARAGGRGDPMDAADVAGTAGSRSRAVGPCRPNEGQGR